MKIYISGPITGTNDYMERFANAARALRLLGHEVVNPAAVNSSLPEGTTHKEYMNVSFALMDMCDTVFFLEGYVNSKGCMMELDYALLHKMSITFEGGRIEQSNKIKAVQYKDKKENLRSARRSMPVLPIGVFYAGRVRA